METIIWSCAFPLRLVQTELFFGVDYRCLTMPHSVLLASSVSVSVSLKLNWRKSHCSSCLFSF